MSEITTLIHRYRDGKLTLNDLIEQVGKRKMPLPERYKHDQLEPGWLDKYPWYTDGTWDEVARAHSYKLLTDAEFDQLAAAQREALQATA